MSELTIVSDHRATHAVPDGEAEYVTGVLCKGGHFNDPDVAYCVICGISMLQSPRKLVQARRPQLGLLVFGNGMAVPIRRDIVLGRAPESDAGVLAGAADGVRLVDPLVDAAHARLTLRGWQISLVDAGSAGGTFVRPPGGPDWTRLTPGVSVDLAPGSSAAFGRCVVTYYSHRDGRRVASRAA